MKKFRASKVTQEVFDRAKDYLSSGIPDNSICDACDIGRTTLKIIKNCATYTDYKNALFAKRKRKMDRKIAKTIKGENPETVAIHEENQRLAQEKLRLAQELILTGLSDDGRKYYESMTEEMQTAVALTLISYIEALTAPIFVYAQHNDLSELTPNLYLTLRTLQGF